MCVVGYLTSPLLSISVLSEMGVASPSPSVGSTSPDTDTVLLTTITESECEATGAAWTSVENRLCTY